jgi:hypothetical protein
MRELEVVPLGNNDYLIVPTMFMDEGNNEIYNKTSLKQAIADYRTKTKTTTFEERLDSIMYSLSQDEYLRKLSGTAVYQQLLAETFLTETIKRVLGSLLSEMTMKDLLVRLVLLQRKFGQSITQADIERVIRQILIDEKYEDGDEKAIQDRARELATDKGVLESIFIELRERDIAFVRPTSMLQ